MKIYKVLFFNTETGEDMHESYFKHESSAKVFLKKTEKEYEADGNIESKGYMGELNVFTEILI